MRFLFFVATFGFFASPATARDMCFEREFSENTRYEVEVGWGEPNPLDPNPEEVVATVDPEALLEALRALDKGWKTPSTIWPQSAVQIRMYERGLMKCQVIYTREEIYAMDDDLDGFLRRPLAVSDYFALDDALDIAKYRSLAQ